MYLISITIVSFDLASYFYWSVLPSPISIIYSNKQNTKCLGYLPMLSWLFEILDSLYLHVYLIFHSYHHHHLILYDIFIILLPLWGKGDNRRKKMWFTKEIYIRIIEYRPTYYTILILGYKWNYSPTYHSRANKCLQNIRGTDYVPSVCFDLISIDV